MQSAMLLMCVLIQMILTESKISTGFILTMDQNCGSSTLDVAFINITTDMHADIKAVCRNGDVAFATTDSVHFWLDISYHDNTSQSMCMFPKRKDTNVYSILVIVAFIENGYPITRREQRTTITCTFDKHGYATSSHPHRVFKGTMPKLEIQEHVGQQTNSNVTLYVCDIKGRAMTERELGLGRLLQITVLSDGAGGEAGIHPNHCDAVGIPSRQRYAVLIAGCGDGVVMYSTKGFSVDGNTAISPYFEMFELQGDRKMMFECNVTLCSSVCDGSTCPDARRKRSKKADAKRNSSADESIRVRSRPITISHKLHGSDVTTRKFDVFPDTTTRHHHDSTCSNCGHILMAALCVLGILVLIAIALSIPICCRLKQVTPFSKINTWRC